MAKNKDYYTAGELAEMFHLPKQTLLYYDKINLLKPEFVSTNNYRHYTDTQYMILEIIVNLRKLNISINDIKDYLRDRNPHKLQKILEARQKQLEQQIIQAEEAMANISIMMDKVAQVNNSRIGMITLEHRPQKRVIYANLTGITDSKALISLYAQHNITAWEGVYFQDKVTGWIIDKELYFKEHLGIPKAYYTVVDDSYTGTDAQLLSEGLYLSADIKGVVYADGCAFAGEIYSFLERNNLEPISDIYCLPIKDHWMTDKPQEYINRIGLQVRYKTSSL